MNLDSLSFTLSQISFLVANLNKKNYRDSCEELADLVRLGGVEADRHLLRCLFLNIDFYNGEAPDHNSPEYTRVQLLKQECFNISSKPAFISNICFAVNDHLNRGNQKVFQPSRFFQNVRRVLGLTLVQDILIAQALQHSPNSSIASLALEHFQKQIPELVKNYVDANHSKNAAPSEEGLHDATPEVLHQILTCIFEEGSKICLSASTKNKFLKFLKRDFPREVVPIVLAPLLYPRSEEETQQSIQFNMAANQLDNTNYAELLMELGHGFTSSVEECRKNLANFGGRELTTRCVARILAFMARTSNNNEENALGLHSFWENSTPGQDNKDKTSDGSNWNIEIFVKAVAEVNSTISWNEVIGQLDHPEFVIKDRQGLNLLITGLRLGLQIQGYLPEQFPVELFYRHWENVKGQLSLVHQIILNPDVFCFAEYAYHSVTIDVLKTAPDADSKEAQTWRSVNVVELLLYLADRGLMIHVQEIFKWPMQHCPDVLILALLQINTPITVFKQDLLTSLLPLFLNNHPNSAVVLHYVWHHNNTKLKTIVMHTMAEWYLRGEYDQTRLSRILDVAQDLKALSNLLNAQSFPFVIDLACLASRREYLKLEKWLTDKIRDHGEAFVGACIKFLQRRCPQVLSGAMKDESSVPKATQLPTETLTTILHCLQTCVGSVSQDCADAILNMVQNCSFMLSKQGAIGRIPPPVMRHRGIETFSPLGGQLFPPKQVDPLSNLNSSLASINLNSSLGPPSNSAFNLPATLGPLVSTPGSPSRLIGSTSTPFPVMQLPSQLHSGPVGTQGSSAVIPSHVNAIGGLNRLAPPTAIEKTRMQETANLFPEGSGTLTKEIEDEANSYFQRIYNHPPHPTLSIDEVLDMLKKFQDSTIKRERDVYSCMLRNLFEEYRFFPQYPDRELHITAQLFGGIIERGLINSYVTLGLALRFVLDALRKPDGNKMYYFGIAALDRFKTRLKEYTTYCEHVRSIPHFTDFPPHLIEYVEYGLTGQEPPTRPQGQVIPKSLSAMLAPVTTPYKTITTTTATTTSTQSKPSTTPTSSIATARPSIANATNIDTLLTATDKEENITSPPESMQDKTAFIFNNLSQLNLQQKCDEIKDLVSEEYYPWMAQYLVMKRASIELNFHALYSNFLDCLKAPEVNKMVTRETFRNIRVLLRSDKGIANFSDRSLLKNLGHWLGMLTLGRNKPILQIDIDLKALLVEAYCKGQQELLYVVPFVAKVLESCAKSRVFRPPNPWTMAIMNVLAELHQEQDLKLNLKFEIEVLCKNLSIDVVNLKPAIYLKDPDKLASIEFQLSQPSKKPNEVNNATNQQSVQPGPQQGPEDLVGPGPTISQSQQQQQQQQQQPQIVPVANTTPSLPTGPPEPRFSYMDIQVTNIASIAQHITINSTLPLFVAQPQLKQFVRQAVERAIQEWIHPIVDRSIKIAITTTEQTVKKDFALDHDENKMRTAARHMVRNLTAGMAMITSRDQIMQSISTNLKNAFIMSVMPQQKEIAEQTANIVAAENMELACAFIQKTAIEKAIPEMEKRLHNEYEVRKIARQEGRRYIDAVAKYQAERMPEQIRLKVGGVTPQQMTVYEEFARNIPGFLPLSEREVQALFTPKNIVEQPPIQPFTVNATPPMPIPPAQQVTYTTVSNDEVGSMLEKLGSEVEMLLATTAPIITPQHQAALHSVIDSLIMTRRSRDVNVAMGLLKKAVEGLLNVATLTIDNNDNEIVMRYKELHLRILKCLQDPRAYGMQWTNKNITRFVIEYREEYKYNFDVIDCLIRSHLLTLQQYDVALAQAMEVGNVMAVAFAIQIIQVYLIDERQTTHVTESDLYHTIEILARMALHRNPPEGIALFRLTSIIESLRANHDPPVLTDRAPAGPTAHIHSGILQVRAREGYEDPPGLLEKTEYLLREWVTMYHIPTHARDPTKAFSTFVQQMNLQGILKTDELITRFFKLSTQMCVDHCYRALAEATNVSNMGVTRAKCFHTLDAFVRLVALLVKHSGDQSNTHTKINLLNKVLGIVAGVLLQDHELRGTDFQQLPYHRIFIMLFLELCAPEPVLEALNFQVLTAFCHTLHILRPAKAPGFCYAWLELVSHRVFIGRMLVITPQQRCWGIYAQLLIDLFKYLAPYLRNAELAKPVTLLYKGTLRVLLVLLHDFPEFLCDYHYGFCDVIPPNCIQMRNLILSAFPRNMRLPDPFTPNLKVDMLQEIAHAPRVLTNFASLIQPISFKKELDSYLKARAPVTFLSDLRTNLQVSQEPGMRYNIQLMNALVLYVGTQAIAFIRSKGLTPSMSTIAHSAHMDIFQNLAVDLDTEGRYLFLNAIANQLRYPNSHTHYFSCTLLYLFSEANTEAIQEQITRVLLERLIVNRPHPWGLLITFIELIKNTSYKFWEHEFVHCAHEIEKLFESVARSCMVPKQVQPAVDNEIPE